MSATSPEALHLLVPDAEGDAGWLDLAQTIAWSGRSRATVQRWARAGHVRHVKIRGRVYYRLADLPERHMRPTWEV